MFGLVRPCYKEMKVAEKKEYRCYYCGLCVGMGRCAGILSRFFINYDICLAYLVADSLSEDTQLKKGRCPVAPYKRIFYRDNTELLDHMSEINFMLTYHKVLDDVIDDNSLKAKIVERLLRKRYKSIAGRNQEIVSAISEGLNNIHKMENANQRLPVEEAAQPFGNLLERVMADCLADPLDSEVFSMLCRYLGMWIYVIDACVDLKEDWEQRKYNPILAGMEGEADWIFLQRREEITNFLIGCKQSMQQLLELISCAKNRELVDRLFEYIVPREIALKLQ